MSEMVNLAKVDPVKAADLCLYFTSEEQEVHPNLLVKSPQPQKHHKTNLLTSGLRVCQSAGAAERKLLQVCNVNVFTTESR